MRSSPTSRFLRAQVKQLFRAHQNNRFFGDMPNSPGSNLTGLLYGYSHDSVEEAQLALKHNYSSWIERPGAVGIEEQLSAVWERGAYSEV